MRPVEMLFGPTGAQEVIPSTMLEKAEVICRNSLKRVDNHFVVDLETGRKIAKWIAEGKPGCIQDVFPELTVDQREMMISGMTPKEFEEAVR